MCVSSKPTRVDRFGHPPGASGTLAVIAALVIAALPGSGLASLQQDVLDRAPAGQAADTVTYREAVQISLRQNTSLQRARRSADVQGAEATRQTMDFLPSLQLSNNVSRTFGRSFSQQEGEILSQTSNFVDIGGSASLQLFNGFEKWASLEQAQQEEAASRRQVDRARKTAVFGVVDRFVTLLQNQTLMQVRRQELETQEELLEQVQKLVEVGRRPKSDLYQQQAARAEAEAALVDARRQERIAETELISFLHLDPSGRYAFEAPTFPDSTQTGNLQTAPAGDAIADELQLDSLMNTALAQRADLRALQRTVAAQEQGVRVAESGRWPSLSLSFDYGSDWSSNAERPRPGGDGSFRPSFFTQLGDRRGGGVSLSMSVPVFSRLQPTTQVQSARVALDNARYDLRDQRQTVALQVRQALLEYRSAMARVRATQQRLEAARRAREATRRRYELGAATFVELTQAASTFVSARSSHVRARFSAVRARQLIDYQTGTLVGGPGSNPQPPRTQ